MAVLLMKWHALTFHPKTFCNQSNFCYLSEAYATEGHINSSNNNNNNNARSIDWNCSGMTLVHLWVHEVKFVK